MLWDMGQGKWDMIFPTKQLKKTFLLFLYSSSFSFSGASVPNRTNWSGSV
jgi:hypothetical protein